MSDEITRFDIDMDGSMEPSEQGQWVRFEDAQQRKPLTDAQREEIAKGWRGRNWAVGDIIDAIEAAHGIKENT